MKKKFSVYDIVVVGIMAAFIFVCTRFLSIPIPTATGTTMLKTANAVCLISGLLFGPIRGGLAAGIGSMLFDLTFPEYAPQSWITFILFFIMGCVCGLVSHWGKANGDRPARNVVACAVAAVTYSLCYIAKSVITLTMAGSTFFAALTATGPKMIYTSINAVVAVIAASVFAPILRSALKKAGLSNKLGL